MKRVLPFLIIGGVLGAALLAVWYLKRSVLETVRVLPSSQTSQPNSVPLGANPPHELGTTDAPVMLEEFGDFECPPCGLLHPVLNMMKRESGPRLVIVFREFPLSKHPHAMAAGRAAEAAGLQGKFWEMHDLLYENQKAWHEVSDVGPIFEEYATRIGLSVDQFNRDVRSGTVEQRIALDRERGYWIGINSTPSVFLNGRQVLQESLEPEKLRDLIKTEILTSSASPSL